MSATATEIQHQATESELRALFWAMHGLDYPDAVPERIAPRLEAYREEAAVSSNPMVADAYRFINGEALQKADRVDVIRLLNHVSDWAEPDHLERLATPPERKEERPPSPQALAQQLWPGARLSLFHGRYPEAPQEVTCSWWGSYYGRGDKVDKYAPVRYSLWRGYTTAHGKHVSSCPHCKHERVMEFCEKIEQAAQVYITDLRPERNQLPMRWVKLSKKEARRLKDRNRKRRQDGWEVNHVTFPMGEGHCVILHDEPDEPGEPLPTDRAGLYDLVRSWALATPKGKRAGRGLGTWGKPQKEKNEEEEEEEKKKQRPQQEKEPGWRIFAPDRMQNHHALAGYFTGTQNVPMSGCHFDDFTAQELANLLHEAEIDYITEGAVPDAFTLKRGSNITPSAKCETVGGDSLGTALQPTPEEEIDAIMGRQPAFSAVFGGVTV